MKTNSLTTTSDLCDADALKSLYRDCVGSDPCRLTPITGSASSRRYYRIDGDHTLIGTVGTSIPENEAFLSIDAAMADNGVNIPHVVAISDDRVSYLQEDIGDESLYNFIDKQGFTPYVVEQCKKAISQLVKFQTTGLAHVDTNVCYPVSRMAGDSVMWDLNYFKYCFLKLALPAIDEPALEHDFKCLVDYISTATPLVFIHRDFQSRNIMLHNDDAWIIDFQGARLGPGLYDVVSFLWQTRANFPSDVREQLLDYYIDLAGTPGSLMKVQLPHIILFRMLQVLGAYGFRGLIEDKPKFKTQIPRALVTARDAIRQISDGSYTYLESIFDILCDKFVTTDTSGFDPSALTVTMSSFSYKKGLPIDTSGNGGGFVFDCRAVHNPGRYAQYRDLTGDDPEVIEFLERDGEITVFLRHCKSLVDASVRRYLERGFTHLSVSFGCTGGQHRSVYSASHMARHLASTFGVHVILQHREQNKLVEYNKPL